MADINSQVLEALNQGIGPQDIINHLSSSENPEHKNWVRQYRLNQVENDSKDKLGLTESAVQTNEDAIKKQAELINQQGDVGVSPGKLAQIGIVGKVGYELGKQIPAAAEYGSKLFGTLKDKMAVPSEVQATNAEAPVAEAAPSGMDKLKQRLNPVPTIPAPVLSPEEVRQQRLKAAAAAAQGEMTPVIPGAVAPAATPVVEPTVVTEITPVVETAIAKDVTSTPVEKAQALVHTPEIPPAETTKATPVKGAAVPRAERGSLAGAAMNPTPVAGQPGLREQYNIPKGINPATGEKFMGPGGFNYLTGQVGPERAAQAWEEQYGKRNVPAKQVIADYAATRYPPTAVTAEGKSGGAFEKPKYIPEYIKGAVTPGALATTAILSALPALGVAAVQKYKGNKTAVDASVKEAQDSLQSLVTMPYDVSKAALKGDFGPLKDLMLSINPGSLLFNEMNKHDEEIIKKMIQKEKVGAGRGMQGVPPPSAYNR